MIEKYIKIITKLPSPELFPNRKNGTHWSKTDKIKKQDKEFANLSTKKTIGCGSIFNVNDRLNAIIFFIYGDNRRRDNDNILAAFKTQLDGIFLALNIDDSQIDILTINRQIKDKANPRCEIEIRNIKMDEVGNE